MDDQVIQYIAYSRAKGLTMDAIKGSLITQGWTQENLKPYFPASQTSSLAVNSSKGFLKVTKKDIPGIILRVGIAFVFLYAAIFVAGDAKTGAKYVPEFVTAVIPLQTFLYIFGGFEILLALWILSGKLKLYSGILAAVTLTAITAIDHNYFSITFRNVAIICACLALSMI